MDAKDLTTGQVAERVNASERTVRLWCKQGLFPNARTQETPFGDYWLIPESDLEGFKPPKMGRPRKPPEEKTSEKGSKKKGGKK